jgi:hypothetical protein
MSPSFAAEAAITRDAEIYSIDEFGMRVNSRGQISLEDPAYRELLPPVLERPAVEKHHAPVLHHHQHRELPHVQSRGLRLQSESPGIAMASKGVELQAQKDLGEMIKDFCKSIPVFWEEFGCHLSV